MFSCCNLLLLFCRDYCVCKSDSSRPNVFYIYRLFFAKDLFSLVYSRSSHSSADVIMNNYVIRFQSNRVNFVSSRRLLNGDYRTKLISNAFFSMSGDVVLAFSGPPPNSYIRQRDFYPFRVVESSSERK